jgi:signal transduction histidine kinase
MLSDVTRLVQVVNNVLSSTIKFTAEGLCNSISSQTKSNGRCALILTISDSTLAFQKKNYEAFFDSFSQNNIDNNLRWRTWAWITS